MCHKNSWNQYSYPFNQLLIAKVRQYWSCAWMHQRCDRLSCRNLPFSNKYLWNQKQPVGWLGKTRNNRNDPTSMHCSIQQRKKHWNSVKLNSTPWRMVNKPKVKEVQSRKIQNYQKRWAGNRSRNAEKMGRKQKEKWREGKSSLIIPAFCMGPWVPCTSFKQLYFINASKHIGTALLPLKLFITPLLPH